ncbi:hypothetical protein QP202_24745, partial [Escherichia coli]|nr:hypothetical protein [Escherichia coli]
SVSSRIASSLENGFTSLGSKATNALSRISAHFAKGSSGARAFGSSVKELFTAFSLANLASKAMSVLTQSFYSAVSRFDTLKQFPKIMQSWGYSADDASAATKRLS